MMSKKTQKTSFFQIGAGLLALLFAFLSLSPTAAAEDLKQPVYAYGQSLTDEQKKETARLLGVKNDALEMQVNINEMNDLLHDDYNYYQVYSSVYLDPAKKGEGVSVEIVTPETITDITATQYANAAITAGATDMNLRVASVKAVDGSGALAGVYKAFHGTTGQLPEENIKVAQEELRTTSKINEENQDKEGYSDDLLNAAIAEIKAKISAFKEENNGTIQTGDVTTIFQQVINNYNLDSVLSEDNKQALQGLMERFSELKLTEEQKADLRALGEKLLKSGGELMEQVKTQWNNLSSETKGEIGGFFGNLFRSILDFFRNLFQ